MDSPRVRAVLQYSPRSFHHRFHLTAPEDLDREMLGWLEGAYQVGMMAGRRVR